MTTPSPEAGPRPAVGSLRKSKLFFGFPTSAGRGATSNRSAFLAQVLAKQTAAEAGATEALDGRRRRIRDRRRVQQCVDRDPGWGFWSTRGSDHSILKGNYRELGRGALAAELGRTIRAARPSRSRKAYGGPREIFITSATTILPAGRGKSTARPVANGHPGEVATALRERYLDYAAGRQNAPVPLAIRGMNRSSLSATPEAVLFDWDNTLVEKLAARDPGRSQRRRWPMSARRPFRHGAGPCFQPVTRSARCFRACSGDDWQRSRKIFLDHFEQNHLAGLSIMTGAETVMDAFAERGIPLAIVSNKVGNLLRRESRPSGLVGPPFFAIVGRARMPPADKAPIRHRSIWPSARPEIEAGPRIWMVGDTDTDMPRGDCRGLLRGFSFGPGPEDPGLLEGAEPALRFQRFASLLAGFVRGLGDTISQ